MTPLNAIKYFAWDAFYVAARNIDIQEASEDYRTDLDYRYSKKTSGADALQLERSKIDFFTPFLLEEQRLDRPAVISDYIDTWIQSRDFQSNGFESQKPPTLLIKAEEALRDWEIDKDLQLAGHDSAGIKYDFRIAGYTLARLEGLRIEAAKKHNPRLHLPHINESDLSPENIKSFFYDVMLDGIQRYSPQMALEMDSIPHRLHDHELNPTDVPNASRASLPSRRWDNF